MNNILQNEIIENLPLVLFVVDGNFRMQYLNSRFTEMFSCQNTATAEVGKLISCQTLINGGKCTCEPECTLCMLRLALNDCIAKGRQVFKKLIEKKVVLNGKTHLLSLRLTVSPVSDDDKYICVVDDVTEIIKLSARERQLNKQLLTDLNRAKDIQRDLLPKPGADGIIFDYIYRQINSVGGDFFDVYRIDDTHIGAYIADVSGHGLGGGMLTVFLKENFNRRVISPALALDELYAKFNRFHFSESSYITLLAAVYDEVGKTLTYCNAGHGVPMLVEKDGYVMPHTERGTPISNWFKSEEYGNKRTDCPPGSRILFTTDGIVDMMNASGAEFGMQPLKDCLLKTEGVKASLQRLNESIDRFQAAGKDDIAVFILEV